MSSGRCPSRARFPIQCTIWVNRGACSHHLLLSIFCPGARPTADPCQRLQGSRVPPPALIAFAITRIVCLGRRQIGIEDQLRLAGHRPGASSPSRTPRPTRPRSPLSAFGAMGLARFTDPFPSHPSSTQANRTIQRVERAETALIARLAPGPAVRHEGM
jgi:hypothetical protein